MTIIDIDDVFCILGEIIDKLIDFVTFFYFILVKNEAKRHGMLPMVFVLLCSERRGCDKKSDGDLAICRGGRGASTDCQIFRPFTVRFISPRGGASGLPQKNLESGGI